MEEREKGKAPSMVIFTAPSGAGKTTIVRHLLKQFAELDFSVSATNRKQRTHEIDEKDYYFLSTREFLTRIKADEFLEWEEVYADQFYGTLRSEVDRLWKAGKHIIFDIEVKGATNLKKEYGDQALAVFIKPPSPEVLFQRLRNRKTESEKSLLRRIARATEELKYENSFDTVLVNDDLNTALRDAEKIVSEFLGIKRIEKTEP